MTAQRAPSIDEDQGANLVFSGFTLAGNELVQLPDTRVGLEVPTVLNVRGPIDVAGETVDFGATLRFSPERLRYGVEIVSVQAGPGREVTPDQLRLIRWGEIFSAAASRMGRVVTTNEDGTVDVHRSSLTLSDDERLGALWLQARLGGLNPNQHIAAQLGISASAAAARVKRARDRKAIPPTSQGRRR